MQSNLAYEKTKFEVYRLILALFFVIWFFLQFMDANEFYSNAGIWHGSQNTFKLAILSDGLVGLLTPQVVNSICILGILCSLSLLSNRLLIYASFSVWLIFSFLCIRTPFLIRVWMPFLGWTLLALPAMMFELRELSKHNITKFKLPLVLKAAWFVAGLSYFVSGLSKLRELHWASGNGLSGLEGFPYRTMLYFEIANLRSLSVFLNYSVIVVELASLPLVFFDKGRLIIWNLLLVMHLGILFLFRIPTITIPMLIFHLFLFDTRWIQLFFSKTSATIDH